MNIDRLSTLAISDSGFIFDPSTGNSYNTNTTGIQIISCLKQNKDMNELIDVMIEKYEVASDELESDLNDFIQNLKNYHLIS